MNGVKTAGFDGKSFSTVGTKFDQPHDFSSRSTQKPYRLRRCRSVGLEIPNFLAAADRFPPVCVEDFENMFLFYRVQGTEIRPVLRFSLVVSKSSLHRVSE